MAQPTSPHVDMLEAAVRDVHDERPACALRRPTAMIG
jgi:hypothetical protein